MTILTPSEMKIKTVEALKIGRFDKFICYLCLFDVLFFPYIRIFSASLSMLILPIWFLIHLHKIRITFEPQLFILFFYMAVSSILLSALFYPGYLGSNLVQFVILMYGFLYYFFFKFYFDQLIIPLKNILMAYLILMFLLAVIYIIEPSRYFEMRAFWTMSGQAIQINDSLVIHRFTGIFSDPNNAAVAYVGIYVYLFYNTHLTGLQSSILLLFVTIMVLSTMSSTGLILLILTIGLFVLRMIRSINPQKRMKVGSVLFVIIFGPALLVLLFYLSPLFFSTEVGETSLERLIQNSADSRISIWKNLLKKNSIFKYILQGTGGTILVDGVSYKPHNGHLHLIYNYGLIVYLIFLSIFFKVRKGVKFHYYLFLIPFFLGFTINVGIYEVRFINLLALLVAMYSSTYFQQNESMK